jgi:hypothetical protein
MFPRLLLCRQHEVSGADSTASRWTSARLRARVARQRRRGTIAGSWPVAAVPRNQSERRGPACEGAPALVARLFAVTHVRRSTLTDLQASSRSGRPRPCDLLLLKLKLAHTRRRSAPEGASRIQAIDPGSLPRAASSGATASARPGRCRRAGDSRRRLRRDALRREPCRLVAVNTAEPDPVVAVRRDATSSPESVSKDGAAELFMRSRSPNRLVPAVIVGALPSRSYRRPPP